MTTMTWKTPRERTAGTSLSDFCGAVNEKRMENSKLEFIAEQRVIDIRPEFLGDVADGVLNQLA
jgi:hypothetical protein